MKNLLGCFGILIIIAIIISLINMLFQNIIGILGIAIAIWGAYQWSKNRKLGAKSKVPAIIILIGLLISIAWFSVSGNDTELADKEQESDVTQQDSKVKNEEEQKAEKLKTEQEAEQKRIEEERIKAEQEALVRQQEQERQQQEALAKQQEQEKQRQEALAQQQEQERQQQEAEAEASQQVQSYSNCTQLRQDYPAGVPSSHPAYASRLDRDKDNYACER